MKRVLVLLGLSHSVSSFIHRGSPGFSRSFLHTQLQMKTTALNVDALGDFTKIKYSISDENGKPFESAFDQVCSENTDIVNFALTSPSSLTN